jgi:hypothetical protein
MPALPGLKLHSMTALPDAFTEKPFQMFLVASAARPALMIAMLFLLFLFLLFFSRL